MDNAKKEENLKNQTSKVNEEYMGDEAGSSGESIPGEDNSDKKDMDPAEKILTLEAELTQAKAKADDYYDRLMRLQAEFDNYRRRTQKEKLKSLNMPLNNLWVSCCRCWIISNGLCVRLKIILI